MIDAGAVLSQVDGQQGLTAPAGEGHEPADVDRAVRRAAGVDGARDPRRPRGEKGGARQTFAAVGQGPYSASLEIAFRIARALVVPLDAIVQFSEAQK